MKIKIIESEGFFMADISPENMEDQNQLVRMSLGSRKKTITIETIFYQGGLTRCYITAKKFKRKDCGTVK